MNLKDISNTFWLKRENDFNIASQTIASDTYINWYPPLLFSSFGLKKGRNYILLFPSSTQNCKKSRGGYQLILVSLTIVSDDILKLFSLLCQKVLELSFGFN